MKMKKCIGLLVSICMIASLTVPVFAADNGQVTAKVLDESTRKTLMNIPIFFVTSVGDSELTEEQKDDVAAAVSNYCDGVMGLRDASEYEILPLNDSQKKNVLESPIYDSTFSSIQDIIDSGVTVKYINLFSVDSPNTVSARAAGDTDDLSYWENNTAYLGTYDGYRFQYLESSAGVESSEVTPNNITGSLKWNEIAKKTLQVVCDHYVKNDYYKAVKAVANGLSTLFSFYENPLTVSYSSSQGYVKAKVSGDIYIRTVLIRDDLDRVKGYAYYNWGTTQRFAAALRVDAKYPYHKNSSGTYEYRYPSYTYPTQYSNTPGYYGGPTFYKSVIDLYKNTIGYFTHDERIDVYSAVASLLS